MTMNDFLKEFQQAVMYLCLFHILRTFKRKFSPDKMDITVGQCEHLLELLTNMIYAKSKSAYMEVYTGCLRILPYNQQ